MMNTTISNREDAYSPDIQRLQNFLNQEITQARILHDENTQLRETLADREERIERLQAETSSCQQQITAYRLREQRRQAFIRNKDLIALEKLVALEALEEVERKRIDITEPVTICVEQIAAAVGASPASVGKKFANLDKTGLLNYTIGATEYKDGSYYTPVTVAFTDLAETPGLIQKAPQDKHGGSREKRCAHCGSEDIDRYTVLYCRECQRAGWYGQIGLRSDAIVTDAMKAHPFPIVHDAFGNIAPERVDTSPDFPIVHDAFGENDQDVMHPETILSCKSTDSIARQDEKLQQSKEVVNTGVSIQAELQEPPEELRTKPIWCCHRAKVPYQVHGRSPQKARPNDPATWSTYEETKALYERSQSEGWANPFDGIGLMCDGTFTVTDHDHCIDEAGLISQQEWERVLIINSYGELSLSRTGVHTFSWGVIPSGRKRADIEMYSQARFIVWTGQHIIGTPATLEDRQELLTALYTDISPAPLAPLPQRENRAAPTHCDYTSLTDAQVLEKARNAANGAKFRALFDEGNMSDYLGQDGRPDHSRADQAMCNLLAYWTNGDAEQIDRLFRQSKLIRSKWDRNARAGETYGAGTIRRAIACYQKVSA